MVHAIIYANREGYDFFERTEDFPRRYLEDIYRICSNLTVGTRSASPALRYSTLEDRGLLTVIFRLTQGSSDAWRPHVVAVNFLMEAPDVRRFFGCPLREGSALAIETAQELLNIRDKPLPSDLLRELPQRDPEPDARPNPDLLSAAIYGMNTPLVRQLFIQDDLSDPIDQLQALLDFLTPQLRPTVSFHTDCLDACESSGVAICYTRNLREMIAQDFSGGPVTEKYWRLLPDPQSISKPDRQQLPLVQRLLQIPRQLPLYDFLKASISSWDCLLRLGQLLKHQPTPTLEEVLEVIPGEQVAESICSAAPESEILAALQQAAPRHSPIRTAIRSSNRSGEAAKGPTLFQQLFRSRK